MLNIRPHSALQAPKELPPVHPECKVVFRFQIKSRAEALWESGNIAAATKLNEAILAIWKQDPPYNKS